MVQYFPIVTGSLTVTGSVLVSGSITTNSTITATTLVVQTITSSVSSITGSTKWGSVVGDTHQFTGSLNVTGALAVVTTGTEFQVTNTGVRIGNISTDIHPITGSVNVSGSATFVGSVNINGVATFGTGTSAYTFGGGSAAAGGLTDKDLTLKAWSPTSGTNEYGGNLILSAGVGTGNTSGKLGSVIINAGTEGATSSTLGTLTTVATFTKTGLGVGTSTITAPLTIAYPATGSAIAATTSQQAYDYSRFRIKHYTDSNIGLSIGYAGANYTYIQACYNEGTTAPLFLNPFGNKITINTTDPGPNAQIISSGDQNDPYPIGAKAESASQGLIGFFNNANGVEGSISIASGVVSYNSFMGSHWSQLQDNSKPEILKGTVLETIDEFCAWDEETNDRLAKVKISDTIESKNVYGVFLNWDNTDDFNDMYVAALGAGYIRVNGSQTVQMGDLLQSNGDGTAKVQSDDIVRSSTIAKVVSTSKIETYEDGSYLIAATLHCG